MSSLGREYTQMKMAKKSLVIVILVMLLVACSLAQGKVVNESVEESDTIRGTSTIIQPSQTLTPSRTVTAENIKTPVARIRATKTEMAKFTEMVRNITATIRALTPSRTPIPSLTLTRQPTKTPTIQSSYEATRGVIDATLEAYGEICEPPSQSYGTTISPDGRWITGTCRESEYDVPLKVVSIQGDQEWKVYYSTYAKGEEYGYRNEFRPWHWSLDGRHLYLTSSTTRSGCCWLGWKTLLVRLNLETGQQTEVVNLIAAEPWQTTEFSISPNDRYLLYYLPEDGLSILDLSTWARRIIELDFENINDAGNVLMSNQEDKIILVLREYLEENDYPFYGSVVIINLVSGSQKKLLSGLAYEDTPKPISWQDEDHVLLYHDDQYWLLNIHTAAMEKTEAP